MVFKTGVINMQAVDYIGPHKGTLQMFAGIYRGFIGKSECGDFKFMGIACNPQSL